MAQFLKTVKKDFGLGRHRVTLPEGGGETEGETPSGETQTDSSTSTSSNRAPNKTASSSPSISRLVKEVRGFFGKQAEQKGGSPLLNRSPSSSPSSKEPPQDLINLDEDFSNDRPSPLLHSRVLKKEMIGADGAKGSLENLKTQYGLSSDEDSTADLQEGGL